MFHDLKLMWYSWRLKKIRERIDEIEPLLGPHSVGRRSTDQGMIERIKVLRKKEKDLELIMAELSRY